jgi:hypothetical protein
MGQENASRAFTKYQIASLINHVKTRGFTVTFVGTKNDVDNVVRQLSIDSTNTLVHDNTARGVQDAFFNTIGSTMTYASKVAKGEDVSRGFYKKIVENK